MSNTFDIPKLAEAVIGGNRVALAKAITLVESTKEEHLDLASKLVSTCLSHAVYN